MTVNMLKKFNLAMDYIENNLCQNVDEEEIYNITTYSYSVFARVFSVLVGLPLGEYIRNRRLSKAAIELKNKKTLVIDISGKYGYSSPESFSYAFKKFHGVKPIDVIKKNETEIKIFPPMKFKITVNVSSDYIIKLKRMNRMNVVGVTRIISPEEMKQNIWEDMLNELRLYDSVFINKEKIYGMFYIDEYDNRFRYTLGYLVEENTETCSELTKVAVKNNDYAIIEIRGETPNGIHEAWKYLVGVFLPEESLKYSGDVDFEVFYLSRDSDKKYDIELWIPVKPAYE